MNFQDLKPDMPAAHERSASNGSGRNCLAVAVLLLGMIFLPTASAHAKSSLPRLRLEVHGDDRRVGADGVYFLVSQPFLRVKADLEKSLAANPALRGFKASDDSARLSDMDHWAYIAVSHHPEVRAALNLQIQQKLAPTFTAAVTAGVITAEERTRFEQAIAQQRGYNKETMDGAPFFSRRITRWSYQRRRGTSKHYNDDYIKVMDVSPLLGRAPLTLVWFSSTWAYTGRGYYRSGNAVVPVWLDTDSDTDPDKRFASEQNSFIRFMEKMAKRTPVLSDEDTRQAMRPLYSDEREKAAKAAAQSVDMATTPTIDVQGSDLPADEAAIRSDPHGQDKYVPDLRHSWRMLALPDGSILASGSASHRFVQRGAEVVRLDAVPGMDAVGELKIDPAGAVWGHGMTGDGARFFQTWSPTENSGATYQVCNPDRRSALPLELSQDQISRTCTPRYPDDWIVQSGEGIAFSAGGELFALGKEGKWTHRTWDEKLRRTVLDALNQAMPRSPEAKNGMIHFGDGLFWQADHDGYGIDPSTARVAQTVLTGDVFFGSLSADWGFAKQFYWFVNSASIRSFHLLRHFHIVDLTTGKQRLNVKGDWFDGGYSVARSAHGRLLAISGASHHGQAIVLDMKEGKPLATLRMPKDYKIDAMAFSWQGDKLWLYARKAEGAGERKMIVWDTPVGLTDAAHGTDVPDQLRFSFETMCLSGGCSF